MELKVVRIGKCDRIHICPIGDIQWSGESGPTAKDQLRRHIDRCLKLENPYFVGMGDYIDFLSPSNRRRLQSAGLYDTAMAIQKEKAYELMEQVYENFLKETTGKWLGLVEGHHFFELDGETTDEALSDRLKAPFLGTSAYIRIEPLGVVLWIHHGNGAGVLPGPGLNRLYHVAAGLEGADIYLFGHNTKLATSRLSRPYLEWGKKPRLLHRDIHLVNCGGFSKSNIVGHRVGSIVRGDYAEQGNMTPSPLNAPIITVTKFKDQAQPEIRVSI